MDAIESFLSGAAKKGATEQSKQDYSSVVTDALLDSVRQKESSGGRNVGPHPTSGAAGPYQHIPSTQKMLAAKYGEYDPYNEQQSRERTRQYLTDLVAQNKGDIRGALKNYGGWVTKDGTGYVNDILEGAEKGVGKTTQASADPIESFLSGVSTGKPSVSETKETKAQKPAFKAVAETMTAPTVKDVAAGGVLGAARKIFGPAAAAIGDIALQAPGAAVGQAAYASSRASGRTPEEATQFAQQIQQGISPRQQAIGEIAGVTEQPGYQAVQGAVQFIGENLDKGFDWLSQKLGMPKADVENIASSLSLAAPKVKGAVGEQLGKVKPAVQAWKQEMGTAKPEMAGVGAAEVSAQNLRKARAAELPIPMDKDMMKSDITRRPEDIQFAKTMAKDPRYAAIFQENASIKNEHLHQNLQALEEATGAQQLGIDPAQLGKQLADVVGNAKKARKDAVTAAYDAAKAAGEMEQAVGIEGLTNFVKNNASASKNAPVISAIGAEIKRLSKDGNMSLNDIEELRKMVTVLQQDSGPNSYYASQALKQIDKITEGKGGDLYKQARGLYAGFKKEFDNTPIVREILSMKPGTTERTVALENLVDRTLLSKSTDEIKKLFGSLSKMEGGPEIINELKGALANKITNEVTKGSGTDMYGKAYVSSAEFKKTLAKLDKGGKLDFILGKRQAEQYRTLHKHAEDILTIPKEVVSTSGSGEAVKAVIGGLVESGLWSLADMGGIPVGTAARYGTKYVKERRKLNKINEFVNYGKQP